MKKKSVGLLELETAVLECFLEKTPLSPLGVKDLNLGRVGKYTLYCIYTCRKSNIGLGIKSKVNEEPLKMVLPNRPPPPKQCVLLLIPSLKDGLYIHHCICCRPYYFKFLRLINP
jgi:hypothetical protein